MVAPIIKDYSNELTYVRLHHAQQIYLQEKLIGDTMGFRFYSKDLMTMSFITNDYASFINSEMPVNNRFRGYERQEFLGDSILTFILRDRLFHTTLFREGVQHNYIGMLCSNDCLSKIFDQFKMEPLVIRYSPQTEVTPKQKADIIEALIAAFYLDGKTENGPLSKIKDLTEVTKLVEFMYRYAFGEQVFSEKNIMNMVKLLDEGRKLSVDNTLSSVIDTKKVIVPAAEKERKVFLKVVSEEQATRPESDSEPKKEPFKEESAVIPSSLLDEWFDNHALLNFDKELEFIKYFFPSIEKLKTGYKLSSGPYSVIFSKKKK